MKWMSKDIRVLLQAKEYVDTVFIPLLPVAFNEQLEKVVEMGEYATILIQEIERQLHGRALAVPPFTYLQSESIEHRLSRLEEWMNELKYNQFRHRLLITSDSDWKQIEDKLENALIWFPVIPFTHMDEKYKNDIVSEQTKQLLQIVTKKWQSES